MAPPPERVLCPDRDREVMCSRVYERARTHASVYIIIIKRGAGSERYYPVI